MTSAPEKPLVLVTVGTEPFPFDRPLGWMGSWLAAGGADRVRCLVQAGASKPVAGAECRDYLLHDELRDAIRSAAAVVCHGGPGTIVECRDAGVVPIVVPRRHAFGEHVDDHQVAFAERLAREDLIHLARDEAELRELLERVLEDPNTFRIEPEARDTSAAVRRFGELVDGLVGEAMQDRVRVLYIGGTGRSGSTLLDRMLGQVPGVVSAGELVHLWSRGLAEGQLCGCGERFGDCAFWKDVGRRAFDGWDSLDAAEMLALQHRVDRNRFIPLMLRPGLRPAYAEALGRYANLLARLYRAIRDVSGAEVVVDSSKHSSTAFLLRRVPGLDLRVVHLVRDARGVAHSWSKRVRRPEVVEGTEYMPMPGPVRSSAEWVAFNGLFDLLAATRVPTALVRYESLVCDPKRELRRVLRLADVEGGELSFVHEDAVELEVAHTVSGNPMRFERGPVALKPDEAWRNAMSGRDRALVSAISFPLLVRYGYLARGGTG